MKPPRSFRFVRESCPFSSPSSQFLSGSIRAPIRLQNQARTMTGNTPLHNFYPGPSATKLEATASHQTNGLANGSVNHWATPGPAAFDFRSDTITTPTASMLTAISATTLRDDVYQEDPTTNSLQQWIADMTGKEEGLLVMSGTMGNQVAIRAHLAGPPHAVLCDHRGHILTAEAGGVASLCGAMVQGVVPANGHHLTLEDVKAYACLSDDIHGCPTKLISLENTLGGTIMPLEEARRISNWAREHGIIMHLDGARLWEAVAAGAGSMKEYCDCFDTVQLCFSKGLGAPMGSIIVGPKAFIQRSRWIRKAIGGGIRMAGILSAAARTAVEETFLGGKLQETHQKAKRVAATWEKLGGKLAMPTETNMVWLDLKAAGVDQADFVNVAHEKGIDTWGPRNIIHYQVCEEAIQRLEQTMEEVLAKAKNGTK
ncbi:pyridoxal phosphate-dependent transferase [Phyllosticta citrichinensis]|uniref:Pyridoxal phosphate-dependent transferase n=1 Tax=Phyllosticta citrichinensis TaxID=1130410 RepID=A0ABR1Y2T5_9PEZI